MKICCCCKQSKMESEFYRAKESVDGFRYNCKECGKKYTKDYYLKDKKKCNEVVIACHKRLAKKRQEWLNNVKAFYKCRLCGEKDPVVLEFHHLDDSKKLFAIGDQIRVGLNRLKTEINKCAVLCCNCHRKLHRDKKTVSPILLCNIDRDIHIPIPRVVTRSNIRPTVIENQLLFQFALEFD